MNPIAQITLQHLNTLHPMTFVEDETVKQRFINTYKSTHTGCTDEQAEDFYNRESFYFKQLISANKELLKCTIFSLYGCLLDIIVNGLTFDPASNLMYLTQRGVNIAPKGQQAVWEQRAKNVISPYGELALRIKFGQVKYVDDPVIVYDGDLWEPGYNEVGLRYCIYKTKLPRINKNIIGSFIKITRNDGSMDFPFFTEENIAEWKSASEKQNKTTGANELYTSSNGQINIGFLKAKTIKHSFKTYPKVKVIGGNTELEDAPLIESDTTTEANSTAAQPAVVMPPPSPIPIVRKEIAEPVMNGSTKTYQVDDDTF